MSKSIKLRVPLAFGDEERLYDPQTAEKGKRYFCPACQDTVILRKGEIKTPHFAHKVSEACNQETIIHKTAKQLIVDVISDWKSGKIDAPTLRRTCEICRQFKDQPLPDKVECAILEYRMSDGFVVDVALVVANEPAAAIEVRVSHAVDENKAKSLSIPFIELDGQKVIENPTIFQPIRDRFQPLTCTTCKQAKERFQVKVKEIAKQTGIDSPSITTDMDSVNAGSVNAKSLYLLGPKPLSGTTLHLKQSRYRERFSIVIQTLWVVSIGLTLVHAVGLFKVIGIYFLSLMARFSGFVVKKIREKHIIETCKISSVTRYTMGCLGRVEFPFAGFS